MSTAITLAVFHMDAKLSGFEVDCPQSVWFPATVNTQVDSASTTVGFLGFANDQALQDYYAQKSQGQPVTAQIIGTRQYTVSGNEWSQGFLATQAGQITMQAEVFAVALGTQDQPTGENDANGNPVMASFFAMPGNVATQGSIVVQGP